MIPQGSAPFTLLVLTVGMIGVLIAVLSNLDRHHLLSTPVFNGLKAFNYIVLGIFVYLLTQLLVFLKIILQDAPWLDTIIIAILIGGNGYLVNFIIWLIRYRIEEPPHPVDNAQSNPPEEG